MSSLSDILIHNSMPVEENKMAASNSPILPKESESTSPWLVKSPWGSKNSAVTLQPVSTFEEVMSEQLADNLQAQYNVEAQQDVKSIPDIKSGHSKDQQAGTSFLEDSTLADTSNDALLAQMLQTEMDKEYNQYISTQEQHVNRNSKIKLSFDNYRTDEMFISDEEDEISDEEDISPTTYSDQSADVLEFKKDKGYVIFGKEVVTKHDSEICGRRNMARFEDSFPTQFRTGDATGMDLQLNNKIFNSLKKHAFSEQKRGQRLHETKQHYTAEHAVDERTRLILHRLVDRGIISAVNGVISIGKEAVVIHVNGGDVVVSDLEPVLHENNRDIVCTQIPKECAVKIYKTTLNEFKTRDNYIKDDYRFKDRFKKLNPRKIIHMWAEKELHNLIRMNAEGIPCPEVILLKKHVLVMSFIGENQQPAPKLKSAILSRSQKKLAYDQVLDMMKVLYHKCKLIHADLSEFNLLWHDKKVWMIDVSQSVEPSHPKGLEYLLRDCTNISTFFGNLGVPDVLDSMRLFNEVSGLAIPVDDEAAFLQTIRRMESCSDEHAHQGKNKSSQIFEDIADV